MMYIEIPTISYTGISQCNVCLYALNISEDVSIHTADVVVEWTSPLVCLPLYVHKRWEGSLCLHTCYLDHFIYYSSLLQLDPLLQMQNRSVL